MSVESSRNNPLVVTVDQDTRVEAVFSRVTCGNVGDPCNLRGSPGTIQYSACCDGLVCLSDTELDFWVEGDNVYGTCQSPPPRPTPTPPPTEPIRYSYSLRLTKNISNGGNVNSDVIDGSDIILENNTNITGGSQKTWSATSQSFSVRLSATPSNGYRFVRWNVIELVLPDGRNLTGNFTDANTIFPIPFNGQAEIQAIFEEVIIEPNTVIVTVENNPSSLGNATFTSTGRSNPITVDRNSSVQVTASPNTDRTLFRRWEVRRASDNQVIATLYNPTQDFVASDNIRVIAYWQLDDPDPIRGCTSPDATNYNPNASVDDGSCVYPPPRRGCTDISAANYNSSAEEDDGSCIYPTFWKRCSDGAEIEGNAPSDYRLVNDPRPGGTVCWEPVEDVAIDLRDINFTYQRGSEVFPSPQNFRAENKSFGLTYEITIATNTQLFEVTPSKFTLGPRDNKQISIGVSRNNIERFGDGVSNFNLSVDVQVVGGRAAIPPTPTRTAPPQATRIRIPSTPIIIPQTPVVTRTPVPTTTPTATREVTQPVITARPTPPPTITNIVTNPVITPVPTITNVTGGGIARGNAGQGDNNQSNIDNVDDDSPGFNDGNPFDDARRLL